MQNEPVVHIVDDDDAVRDALSLLMLSEDIAVKTFASADEFLTQHAEEQPGCLLLDVRMPGTNGLELLDILNEKKVTLPVIFITGHGDVHMAVKAMKAGALDFIEKPFDNERLVKVVHNCISTCTDLNDTSEHKREIEARIARLTKREKQIMGMLVDGKQNKVIARELGISPRTVELHRAKVMEKLQAHSLSEVVRSALLVEEIA